MNDNKPIIVETLNGLIILRGDDQITKKYRTFNNRHYLVSCTIIRANGERIEMPVTSYSFPVDQIAS